LVQDKLDIGMRGDPMPSTVMCFWGAFGMGKSWLLFELERRYRCTTPQALGSYPTIAARLDLSQKILPALWQDNRLNRQQLIRELWRQLASQLGIGALDLGQASTSEWVEAFVNQVTAWSAESATPMIMLDTVDDMVTLDEQAFFWLEQHLVERLAMTDRVLFIFTSRGELRRWRRFQVRRRVDSRRLLAFDAGTAGKVVRADPAMSEALYKHAFGHPLVTEYLGTVLENRGVRLQEEESVERFIEPPLTHSILREVVDEILKPVPEVAELTKHTSVLRWVSVEPFRSLAEDLGLAESNRGDVYYLDRIGRLQGHHLLYWSSDKKSYEFDPVLRSLLMHFLELDNPTRFSEAHLAAFDFHRGHLSDYPQYLARYIPELAYHRASLDRCEPLKPLPLTLQAWWTQFLSEKPPQNLESWAELVETLEQDKELQGALPVEDYERLHSEAQERAAGVAG
jgi:hypothetical protein